MIKNKNIKVVKEDAVLGNGCDRCESSFGQGYDDFVYPYTVSFCSEGKYEVVIKDKKAIARKVE